MGVRSLRELIENSGERLGLLGSVSGSDDIMNGLHLDATFTLRSDRSEGAILVLSSENLSNRTGAVGKRRRKRAAEGLPSILRCIAFAGGTHPSAAVLRFSEEHGIPCFRSRWDPYLLKSRLAALIEEKCRHRISMHAALVRMRGIGILLLGDSGVGKTTCSVTLARRGHRWIADDAVIIEKKGDVLIGSSHPKVRNLMVIEGKLLDARTVLGVEAICADSDIALAVELVNPADRCPRTAPGDRRILGISIPCRRLTVKAGRQETAARVEALANFFQRSGGKR